jgi:hypothetical protein
MPQEPGEPNLFELEGEGTRIFYSTSSFAGPPQLHYEGPRGTMTFIGEQLRAQGSEIGKLVTVTLEEAPDLHAISLTLLVPRVNLDGTESTVSTVAILTTQHTSIAGPQLVSGALQSYRTLPLEGVARLVDF